MSMYSLPVETLEQIISSDLEQVDLARLSQVSKLFLIIGRPRLYRSITLQSIGQAIKLEHSRQEDVELVRSVKVMGKGDPWAERKLSSVRRAFKKASSVEMTQMEAGCVKQLLDGKFFNLSNLTSIYIHNVLEDPNSILTSSTELDLPFRPLHNLVELSIVSHRGGFNAVHLLLDRDYLPTLKRLTLCDVSHNYRSLGNRMGLDEIREDPIVDVQFINQELFLNRQLELLVGPCFEYPLIAHPSILHVAVLESCDIHPSNEYAILFISTLLPESIELEDTFHHLTDVAANYSSSSYSLKYLAFPSRLEHKLSSQQRSILNDLTLLGIAIHFDGDLGSVIAPPSFLGFRKKEEEQKARREEAKNSPK
ncbi:hypothetical protein JCM3765_004625 [Sporobolomyces pararoseus]